MAETELKRCPFCGGGANIAKGEIEFWAYCPHCGAQTEFYETEREAAKAWNARPIEDAQAEEIKRLEEENERLQKELNEAIEQNQINVYEVAAQAARGANYALKEVKKLEAENARLREALDTIVGLYEINGGFWAVAEKMHDTARDALKGGEK